MKTAFLLLIGSIFCQNVFAEIVTCATRTDTNHPVELTINMNNSKSTIRYYNGEKPEEGSVLQGLSLHSNKHYRTPNLLRYEDKFSSGSYLELNLTENGQILDSELNLPLAGFVKAKAACKVSGNFPKAPQCESNKNELLMSAIKANDLEAFQWNLNCDADVNYKNKAGCTPLLLAFDSSCGVKDSSYEGPSGGVFAKTNQIFDMLLNNGAFVDVSDPIFKQTALHKAARFKIDGMENFIAAEANFDAQDIYGYTPLMYAVLSNDQYFVKSVLAGNPSRVLKNKKGETAYDLAKKWEKNNVLNIVKIPDSKIEIIGNEDGTCSPLKFEIKKGQTIQISLKAVGKMFLMTSNDLNLELMVGGDSEDFRIITFENQGNFNFSCGFHGASQQSIGEFIVD